jgi:hypothetical protein
MKPLVRLFLRIYFLWEASDKIRLLQFRNNVDGLILIEADCALQDQEAPGFMVSGSVKNSSTLDYLDLHHAKHTFQVFFIDNFESIFEAREPLQEDEQIVKVGFLLLLLVFIEEDLVHSENMLQLHDHHLIQVLLIEYGILIILGQLIQLFFIDLLLV